MGELCLERDKTTFPVWNTPKLRALVRGRHHLYLKRPVLPITPTCVNLDLNKPVIVWMLAKLTNQAKGAMPL